MMTYELAINEDGEPFGVPPQAKGWKVFSAPPRGRPAMLYDRGKGKGKPLIVRVDATHEDLLAAAGPGRYKLEAVDEHRRTIDDVPTAVTGPLSEDDIDEGEDEDGAREDDAGEARFGGSAVRRPRMEDMFCQLMANQTRMVEATLGQMGTVIAGVAGLLQAAHQAGVVHHLPPSAPLPLPPPPVPPPVEPDADDDEDDGEDEDEDDDDDDDDDDDQAMAAAPPSMLPEALRLIIEKAVDKLVPLIFEKITSGDGLGGLPLAAFLDWRKAVPAAPAAVSNAPAPPTAPAPTAAAPTAATAASPPPPAAPASYASHDVATPARPQPPATAPAGAAPSSTSPLGAAPAEMAPAPATSSLAPQALTQQDAAAMLNAHILQIWHGLSPSERSRATQLIGGLSDAQRTAWFAELARLTVPEAVARARAVLRAQPPPAPPNTPLPTATSKGDPS